MTLRARIHRLERTLRPEQRLHVIELPARLAGDEAAIEAALAAKGIVRREGDLTVIIRDFSEDDLPH